MATSTTRTWRLDGPLDVVGTLTAYRHGPYDPAFRTLGGAVWRTSRPDGLPVTVCIEAGSQPGEVTATAWGAGAQAALAAVPDWLGAHDNPQDFAPDHPVLAAAHRRFAGLRIGRTGGVFEALAPAILEQKVTSAEAHRAWAELLERHGEPAPGPAPEGMRVAPDARDWARIPSWDWHRAGVGPQRSLTVVRAARLAAQLERAAQLSTEEADRRLRAVPGIGRWTSAEVRQRALGDADAVSVGDYSLPHIVTFGLAGEERGDDDRMLELLEPYRGHRHRACMLLVRAVPHPPRRAPRAPVRDFRGM